MIAFDVLNWNSLVAMSKPKPSKLRFIVPGVRVLIINSHPWSGHTGVVKEVIFTLVGAMWSVELDNGMNAGVKSGDLLLL